jgi:hypothetical protein
MSAIIQFFPFGLPGGSGSNNMTSFLCRKTHPPIEMVLIRWFFTSFAMACLETARILAASAWDTQSEGLNFSSILVDNVNPLFYRDISSGVRYGILYGP